MSSKIVVSNKLSLSINVGLGTFASHHWENRLRPHNRVAFKTGKVWLTFSMYPSISSSDDISLSYSIFQHAAFVLIPATAVTGAFAWKYATTALIQQVIQQVSIIATSNFAGPATKKLTQLMSEMGEFGVGADLNDARDRLTQLLQDDVTIAWLNKLLEGPLYVLFEMYLAGRGLEPPRVQFFDRMVDRAPVTDEERPHFDKLKRAFQFCTFCADKGQRTDFQDAVQKLRAGININGFSCRYKRKLYVIHCPELVDLSDRTDFGIRIVEKLKSGEIMEHTCHQGSFWSDIVHPGDEDAVRRCIEALGQGPDNKTTCTTDLDHEAESDDATVDSERTTLVDDDDHSSA